MHDHEVACLEVCRGDRVVGYKAWAKRAIKRRYRDEVRAQGIREAA